MPATDIRAVLEEAQKAPSNRNTQPWQVHLVSDMGRVPQTESIVPYEPSEVLDRAH
ncbi:MULTISPECIES: nitroreductase family protein [unclassified Nocardiopsis]|uniref:nitroreductase family protein n=1 Tax=unclassified Nocardiopsis TaxID=2649073 RepID=UPI0018FE0DF8|nr:nitroreductase family protein [Nocardiopsis sp. TSRI0078]